MLLFVSFINNIFLELFGMAPKKHVDSPHGSGHLLRRREGRERREERREREEDERIIRRRVGIGVEGNVHPA